MCEPEGTNWPIWLTTPKYSRRQKSISVSRGMYARIKCHTDQSGESIAGFITGLIEDHIDQGKGEPEAPAPRVYLSCVTQEGEEVDTAIDVRLGIGTKHCMPHTQSLRMMVSVDSNKILLTTELYLNELRLDMPATLIDEAGIKTEGRVTLDAKSLGEYALNPCAHLESLRINGRDDIYAKSMEFSCVPIAGDHVTKLIVHTIKPTSAEEQGRGLKV